jgi:large subunit ribosomal protein L10
MSKPVKQMVARQLSGRFAGLKSVAIVDVTGVDAVMTHRIRGRLRDKDIQLVVVKNSLARQAFREVGLEQAVPLLDGPCAVAYGSDSIVTVVRELMDIRREAARLTVKAAVLDGDVFGPDRVEELSSYPTREEAIAKVVGGALSAGSVLAGRLLAPGGRLASILKAIEERHGGESPGGPETET